MDGHSGDPYRYGDDADLDFLLEKRWALPLEHITAHTEDEYHDAVSEVMEWSAGERQYLSFLHVEKRLTTWQRKKRGLGATKSLP